MNRENSLIRGFVFPIGLSFIILGTPMIFSGVSESFFEWTFPYFVFLIGIFMSWISWNVEILDVE